MSHIQWLGQQGAAAQMDITEDLFLDVLRNFGTVFQLYRRDGQPNCTCISATYGTADRSCSSCKGTGFIGGHVAEAKHSFMGLFLVRTEGRQDQHQRLYSKTGPVDTLDGRVYCEKKWFEIIKIDDVMVWKPKTSDDGYELRIISKNPNIAMMNQRIYTQLDVTKNPYPLRPTATDLRKQI
jgi:hypothetical protein